MSTSSGQPTLKAIWAQSLNAVIGRDGAMPWYAPEDLTHFKNQTLGAPVIMGRKTWESFPAAYRPLPGRDNFVISSRVSTPQPGAGALWVPSMDAALELASSAGDTLWLIGGSSLYHAVFERDDLPHVAGSRVTEVQRTVFATVAEGESTAPELGSDWVLQDATEWATSAKGWVQPVAGGEKKPLEYRFETWVLADHQD